MDIIKIFVLYCICKGHHWGGGGGVILSNIKTLKSNTKPLNILVLPLYY